MGFRFRKSFGLIGKLVKLNINKDSVSVTAGIPGAHVTLNSKGHATGSVGIPGSGLSYQKRINLNKDEHLSGNTINDSRSDFSVSQIKAQIRENSIQTNFLSQPLITVEKQKLTINDVAEKLNIDDTNAKLLLFIVLTFPNELGNIPYKFSYSELEGKAYAFFNSSAVLTKAQIKNAYNILLTNSVIVKISKTQNALNSSLVNEVFQNYIPDESEIIKTTLKTCKDLITGTVYKGCICGYRFKNGRFKEIPYLAYIKDDELNYLKHLVMNGSDNENDYLFFFAYNNEPGEITLSTLEKNRLGMLSNPIYFKKED